jgi:hypothetical protein
MSRLQLEYRDSKTTFIVKAQLLKRFNNQGGKFRFEESGRSEYRDSKYFVCYLYLSTPFVLESTLDNALARSSQKIICEPGVEISIDGGTLLLALPIEIIISRRLITIEEHINLHQTGIVDNRTSSASIKKRLADINEVKKSGIKASTP